MRGRIIKTKDVLWFESSCTFWKLFFLCALVPLPVRAEITCASCFAPIRRTAFVSRDFGSAPDGSTDKNWTWRLDGAQLYPEAHEKSPPVSWRDKLQNAHISKAERTSPAEEKDGKVYPTSSPEEAKVNKREKRSLFPSDSDAGSRIEFRRTGGVDGTGKSPRQNVPHLITSTFALSADSAHNQAMVLWSGPNSSVILILTKLFDFNLGTVTESSLWRSVDFGTTYEKLTDKVMIRTMLSYLYVCPTNKRKILILSDPEVESSLLISSDEGATFQKFNINFYIMSLLFHPTQENWILAYSHDQRLYSSVDFGKKWILVHERVTPGRFY